MTSRKLTEFEKQSYVESDGANCPFCGIDQIIALPDDPILDFSCRCCVVECFGCGAQWIEHYALKKISDVED